MIDERGFQRSSQQIRFHDSFVRATSRVIYRDDWAKSQPAIAKKNGWETTPSEILISTPRRFGKTFSIASACSRDHQTRLPETSRLPTDACVVVRASSFRRVPRAFVQARNVRAPPYDHSTAPHPPTSRAHRLTRRARARSVIFSPARRASRKLLERVAEFIHLLDCSNKITECTRIACARPQTTSTLSHNDRSCVFFLFADNQVSCFTLFAFFVRCPHAFVCTGCRKCYVSTTTLVHQA
jgi:hypothetical protein